MTEPNHPWPAGEIANAVEADVMDPDRLFRPAADFDRLRDERDRLLAERNEACGWAARDAENAREARRVAGVLAGALRETTALAALHYQGSATVKDARSALAVFDTLTEEKT